jgi:predicted transcriptional regulator
MRGVKKYEFRRKIFRSEIEKVYIYSTFPARQVIGFFMVEEILNDTPEEIWEKCKNESGVTDTEFFEYFRGSETAFAIRIGKVEQLREPIEIDKTNLTAPQSFCYLTQDKEEGLVNGII